MYFCGELNYMMPSRNTGISPGRRRHICQPTTQSKFLKALEAYLGQRLFQKLGNKYMLAYDGGMLRKQNKFPGLSLSGPKKNLFRVEGELSKLTEIGKKQGAYLFPLGQR